MEIGTNSTAAGTWGIYAGDATLGSYIGGYLGVGNAFSASTNLDLGASTSGKSHLRLESGVAVTSPIIGDLWFDGSSLNFRKDGSTTTNLLAAASGASIGGDLSGSTSGSIIFASSTSKFAQDNANFFWDVTNHRLGIGTTTPSQALTVNGNIRIAAGAGNSLIFQDGTTMTTAATPGSGNTSTTDLNFAADNDSNGSGETFFSTHGAEALRITNTGRVGIGTSVDPTAQLAVNTAGTNDLLNLQKSGINKFTVANNGGMTVNGATANIVKTTTGNTAASDFSIAGYTTTNVTSQNNEVDIDNGAVTSTMTSTVATTTGATNPGAGAHSIVRDDGTILIIHGNGSALGSTWNGVAGTTTSVTVASSGTVGAGAISLKRPNGKYLLVHGGASTATTILDPWNITAAVTTAIPANMCTAGAGTNAFQRADGKYVIMCGASKTWSVYDPNAGTYAAGTAIGGTTNFSTGTMALQRDDGTFLVFVGGTTTEHYIYNPFNGANGTFSTVNPIISNAPTISTGAFAIRRNDGKYLVVGGAINTSTVYNPTPTSANSGAGSFELINGGVAAAGFGPITTALGDGAQAVRRQDGKYAMMHGGASSPVDIIDPSVTTSSMFTGGTAIPHILGPGGHLVPMPNGKYAIIAGNSTNVIDTYDIGFVMGGNGSGAQLASYETECMSAASLNQSSTLNWNTNAEGKLNFQVRTGTTCTSNAILAGTYKDIANSGDLIRPTAGDNKVQVKVFFTRSFFIGYDQDWGLWRGLSQTRYRAKIADPTLYDLTIDNSSQLHRTQFDLGIGTNGAATDPSGPVSSNVNIAADKSLQLATGAGNQNLATTISGAGDTYNGAFGTHTALATGAMEGTVIMKRPNGRFMVIAGNSATSNAQLYDQNAQTFTGNANGLSGAVCSGTGNGSCLPTNGTTNVVVGRGALAFKRPDGKFLVVLGAATNVTNIYDPVTSSFTNGPTTTGLVGRGALTISLPNGRVLIVHGNQLLTTSVYDPIQNQMIVGPVTPILVGPGSMAIPNANGTWLFISGLPDTTNTATTMACGTPVLTSSIFDPYAMSFNATGAPAITTGTGPGAFAFQRSDGLWVIIKGGATVTSCAAIATTLIYDPFNGRIAVGPVPPVAPQQGSFAMQRPDGSWLITTGLGATTTQVYMEKEGIMTGGMPIGVFLNATPTPPATTSAIGSGAVSFQRDDGKYVIISGGTTTTALSTGTVNTNVQQYDAGWVTNGAYRTEQLNVSDLSTDSTLSWKASPDMKNISAEVRTSTSQLGLQTAGTRDVTTSGGLINPSASETWLQIQFNFKRTFPGNSGIWADTWWNGGSTIAYNWRTIANPTLNEFKVNKDVDLVNLKADGNSMFRVSTNGDIYTSSNGAVRSGGADLAENYTSSETLTPGEVVAVDPLDNHNVKRSNYAYQSDVLGIVSTTPGFVAGSYTADSYPIALVGRVPVNVSTENGMIKSGDRITAASIPGYAMRATSAGRVLGVAMDAMDKDSLKDCPAGGYAPNAKCQQIMVFVNLTDYQGLPVETLMSEMSDSSLTLEDGAAVSAQNSNSPFAQFMPQAKILDFLTQLKNNQNGYKGADILAGNINATNQMISPLIVTDTLIAKNIKAENIEGLQFIQTGIANAQDGVTTNATEVKSLGTQIADLQILVKSLTDKSGGLTVGGPAEFQGPAIFKAMAQFIDKVVFRNNVEFAGQVTFNQDTAGYAIVKAGNDTVAVKFAEEYATVPVVNASLSLQQIDDNKIRKASEDLLLLSNARFIITNVTTTGFEIKIAAKTVLDIPFSWTAIAVKDAKTFSDGESVPVVVTDDTISSDANAGRDAINRVSTDATDTTTSADSSMSQISTINTTANSISSTDMTNENVPATTAGASD